MSAFPIRDVSIEAAERLAREARVHPLTARCLLARGADTVEAVDKFRQPKLKHLRPPRGLSDLERTVSRLADAITGGELVGVFGDYDVDGVTTAALLSSVIEAFGGRALPRVARRSAGYGFGEEDATFFADSCCHIIITGDCGTSDIAAIGEANRRGLPVIVIDHHTVPEAATEHPAFALINPFRSDSSFAFTGFASVGLAFYVMQSLRSELRRRGHWKRFREPDLRAWLDLVAVGTIADLVPLTDENRVMTAAGLWVLNQRRRPGLVELLRSAGVADEQSIGAREVGWKIGPRLNAPGRLGDAEPSLRLLLATSQEDAEHFAAELENQNDERRAAQDEAYSQALEHVEAHPPGPCAVVAGHGWQPGVVGIVAARLVDLLKRPVFVLAIDSDGVARGSARTYGGVNVYSALASAAAHVDRFGGHAAAAGLTTTEDKIDALRASLEAAVSEQVLGLGPDITLADADVSIADLMTTDGSPSQLADELDELRPFGKGNPELRLVARRLVVAESRTVGADRSHLKLVLADGGVEIGAIGFGLAEDKPEEGSIVDVLVSPMKNEWRGRTRMELQIHAIAAAEIAETAEAADVRVPDSGLGDGASVAVCGVDSGVNVPF